MIENGHVDVTIASLQTLSNRVRNGFSLSTILCFFIVFVSFIHKPSVTDDDLLHVTYSLQFISQLNERRGEVLQAFFFEYADDFDASWAASAQLYRQSDDPLVRQSALFQFINQTGERFETGGTVKHRALLWGFDVSLRSDAAAFIESQRSRWEQFNIPMLSITVSKDEILFYLVVAFAVIHLWTIAKLDYLREIRRKFATDTFSWPDPSLLSATPADLAMLPQPLRLIYFSLQLCVVAGAPAIALVSVWHFWIRVLNADPYEHTRVLVSGILLFVELAIAVAFVFARRGRYRSDFRTLWGSAD